MWRTRLKHVVTASFGTSLAVRPPSRTGTSINPPPGRTLYLPKSPRTILFICTILVVSDSYKPALNKYASSTESKLHQTKMGAYILARLSSDHPTMAGEHCTGAHSTITQRSRGGPDRTHAYMERREDSRTFLALCDGRS